MVHAGGGWADKHSSQNQYQHAAQHFHHAGKIPEPRPGPNLLKQIDPVRFRVRGEFSPLRRKIRLLRRALPNRQLVYLGRWQIGNAPETVTFESVPEAP